MMSANIAEIPQKNTYVISRKIKSGRVMLNIASIFKDELKLNDILYSVVLEKINRMK